MDESVVVSAEWLAEHREQTTIVDVRDSWEYDGIGHIPGALNIPFDSFRSSDGDEGMLPGAEQWATLMGEAGIARTDSIVAYDDTHGVFAARFLVTALCYGHQPLHLLNGDYSAWMREHETADGAPEITETTYEPASPVDSPVVDAEAVEAAIDGDAVLVDTRSAEEFAEEHIPSAVNLDWLTLVDEETRGFKSRAELLNRLEAQSITPETRIVLYCNTARRISHTYIALQWLGFEHVAFYEGSLTEWLESGRAVE